MIPKKFFNCVSSRDYSQRSIKCLILAEGNEVTGNQSIANLLNRQLTSVFVNKPCNTFPLKIKPNVSKQMNSITVTISRVKKQ